MSVLRFVFKQLQLLLYLVFLITLLYFPFRELWSYFGRETRFFQAGPMMPVDDALLPILFLAVLYGIVSGIRRRIDPSETREDTLHDTSGN
jgi:hypothetical protein